MKSATTVPVFNARCPEEPIRILLRRRLLALNYHAFAQCLCLLLGKIGYEDVHLAGRKGWKGRNRDGGYDIEAALPGGVGSRKVIVQAKQFDILPVFQRSVDELRGTCLRTGAAEALLITTSTFSPVVERHAAGGFTPIAPVRLLDGEGLLGLMLQHRIGIWEEPGATTDEPQRLGIDHTFFDELAHPRTENTWTEGPRRDAKPRRRAESSPRSIYSGWFVSVRIGTPGLPGPDRPRGKGGA
ncbi:MAG: restriction endonuclease [Armatimonadota bacterium]|nr:restriction endonuclease [Armatimonadota bacterium]